MDTEKIKEQTGINKVIFKKEVTNWKDVGGPDKAITVIGRETGSGTRDGFEEVVKVKDA